MGMGMWMLVLIDRGAMWSDCCILTLTVYMLIDGEISYDTWFPPALNKHKLSRMILNGLGPS
jgi:hypothetical protein